MTFVSRNGRSRFARTSNSFFFSGSSLASNSASVSFCSFAISASGFGNRRMWNLSSKFGAVTPYTAFRNAVSASVPSTVLISSAVQT